MVSIDGVWADAPAHGWSIAAQGAFTQEVDTPLGRRRYSFWTRTLPTYINLGWLDSQSGWLIDGSIYGGSQATARVFNQDDQMAWLKTLDPEEDVRTRWMDPRWNAKPDDFGYSSMVVTEEAYAKRMARQSFGQGPAPVWRGIAQNRSAQHMLLAASSVRKHLHDVYDRLSTDMKAAVVRQASAYASSRWRRDDVSPDMVVIDSTKALIGRASKRLSSDEVVGVLEAAADVNRMIRALRKKPHAGLGRLRSPEDYEDGQAIAWLRKFGRSEQWRANRIPVPRAACFVRTQYTSKTVLRVVQAVAYDWSMPFVADVRMTGSMLDMLMHYSHGDPVAFPDEAEAMIRDAVRDETGEVVDLQIAGTDLATAENLSSPSVRAGALGVALFLKDLLSGLVPEEEIELICTRVALWMPRVLFNCILVGPRGEFIVSDVMSTGSSMTVWGHRMTKLVSEASGGIGLHLSDDGLHVSRINGRSVLSDETLFRVCGAVFEPEPGVIDCRFDRRTGKFDGSGHTHFIARIVAIEDGRLRLIPRPLRQTALAVNGEHHGRKAQQWLEAGLDFGVVQAVILIFVRMASVRTDAARCMLEFMEANGTPAVVHILRQKSEVIAAILSCAIAGVMASRSEYDRQRMQKDLRSAALQPLDEDDHMAFDSGWRVDQTQEVTLSGPPDLVMPWVKGMKRLGWQVAFEAAAVVGVSDADLIVLCRDAVRSVLGDRPEPDGPSVKEFFAKSTLTSVMPLLNLAAAIGMIDPDNETRLYCADPNLMGMYSAALSDSPISLQTVRLPVGQADFVWRRANLSLRRVTAAARHLAIGRSVIVPHEDYEMAVRVYGSQRLRILAGFSESYSLAWLRAIERGDSWVRKLIEAPRRDISTSGWRLSSWLGIELNGAVAASRCHISLRYHGSYEWTFVQWLEWCELLIQLFEEAQPAFKLGAAIVLSPSERWQDGVGKKTAVRGVIGITQVGKLILRKMRAAGVEPHILTWWAFDDAHASEINAKGGLRAKSLSSDFGSTDFNEADLRRLFSGVHERTQEE